MLILMKGVNTKKIRLYNREGKIFDFSILLWYNLKHCFFWVGTFFVIHAR